MSESSESPCNLKSVEEELWQIELDSQANRMKDGQATKSSWLRSAFTYVTYSLYVCQCVCLMRGVNNQAEIPYTHSRHPCEIQKSQTILQLKIAQKFVEIEEIHRNLWKSRNTA